MPATVKRDALKQSWEDTEFPLVCETCLGDNPYVRMTKQKFGKKCSVCETPFTVFAWQAGTKGRLKKVEICRNCAQAKNVCQVCVYDLQYGLPVQVRDKILRESGSASSVAAVPQSQANRSYYTQQQNRMLEQGNNILAEPNAVAAATLQEMAQMEPRYERNLPKLCSFYARGECNRGATCPFRHEFPRDRDDPIAKQNTKDRFFGTHDPVANKILGRKRKMEQQEEKQQEEDGYNKARATVYLRFQGEPPFPALTEQAVRDYFYAHGEIVSVRAQSEKGQAFVEYTQPEAAQLAIARTHRKEFLGRSLHVAWARAPKYGESTTAAHGGSSAQKSAHVVLPPPPGASDNADKKRKLPATTTVKLPPEVLAARQRKQASTSAGPKPHYPSTDPSRLGSATSSLKPL